MNTPPASLAAMPVPGDLLAGKYRVERVIGQGGMGVVYVALHELLAQRVAVKVLLGANNPDAAARFLNEARAAARIQHENIARVMDMGTLESGMPYMVLEFLDGSDLEAILQRDGKLAITTAVDYVLQALEAMAQAHAVGIVHRDLKPANMFLTRRIDGSPHIKVLDFGISKSDDKLVGGAKTSAQAVLGSPYYMSPEQLKSARNVDRRGDVWSVGVVLYELITATRPFDGESVGELFSAILEASPQSPVERRADCPPGLAAVILKCLVRDPALRYDGAPELAQALAPFASPRGVVSAERIRPIPPEGASLPSLSASGAVAPAPALARGPAQAKAQTAASWQTSQNQSVAPGPRASAYAWVIGIALVVGVGVGAAAFFLRGHGDAPAPPKPTVAGDGAATSAVSAPSVPVEPPAPPAPPAPEPQAAPSVTASAVATDTPAPSATPTATPAAPRRRRAKPPGAATAQPAKAP